MPIFLLNYDLNHKDGKDHYTDFLEELRKMYAHRVMNQAALINVRTTSARRVLDHLRPHIDDTDRIFAARVSSENSYYFHAYPGTNEWLQKNGHNEPDAQAAQAAEQGTIPVQ